MITLKNEFLRAEISETGAEIKSIKLGDTEQIWRGAPEVWKSSCPLMFPICGGLKDDKYTYLGREYTLEKHGFGRFAKFEPKNVTESSADFVLTPTEETKKSYPFDYVLTVGYRLSEKSVEIKYTVENRTNGEMYFSIGSHEGYYTPEGIEDYDVIFPEKETLDHSVLYGNLVSDQPLPILKNSNVLPLYEKYFVVDALVFRTLKSRSATLRNRKTGRAVRVDFKDAPYFLIWHKPNAPYICFEPWDGIGDLVGAGSDITKKEGIRKLEKGETYRASHTITFTEEM